MCDTNGQCGCQRRDGAHHWWVDEDLPGNNGTLAKPYHSTNNCLCGDGRCLPTDSWGKINMGPRLQAVYDPSWASRGPTLTFDRIKLPEHCKVCNHHNPYVGLEHLTPGAGAPPGYTGPDMVYVCRQCKPAWDRKERLAALKEEAAERAYEKATYGF